MADPLRHQHPDVDIQIWEVDFFTFESIKKFAKTINDYGRIDAIVLGSAIINDKTKLTKDARVSQNRSRYTILPFLAYRDS